GMDAGVVVVAVDRSRGAIPVGIVGGTAALPPSTAASEQHHHDPRQGARHRGLRRAVGCPRRRTVGRRWQPQAPGDSAAGGGIVDMADSVHADALELAGGTVGWIIGKEARLTGPGRMPSNADARPAVDSAVAERSLLADDVGATRA